MSREDEDFQRGHIGYVRRRSQYVSVNSEKPENTSQTGGLGITRLKTAHTVHYPKQITVGPQVAESYKHNEVNTEPVASLPAGQEIINTKPFIAKSSPAPQMTNGSSVDGIIDISGIKQKETPARTSQQVPIRTRQNGQGRTSAGVVQQRPQPSHNQISEPENFQPESQGNNKKFFTSQKLMTSMAVMLFMFGGFVSWSGFQANGEVKEQAQTLAKQVEKVRETGNIDDVVDIPDEDSPAPDIGSYNVLPLLPKTINIPSIDSYGRVVSLGLKANNQLKAPNNIYDAGWYDGSAKPGEPGAVLIDGHVSGPAKPGIFKKLDKVKEGEKIELVRGDGKKITYTVVKTQEMDADKVIMGRLLVSAEIGKKGLNIITCGGQFDKATSKYLKRTIVYAVQD